MQTRCCRGKKRGTVPFSTQMGPPPPQKKKGTVPSSAQIGAPRGLGVRGAERGKRVRFRGYENSCVFSPCISYRPFLGRGIFLLAKSYSWKFDKTCAAYCITINHYGRGEFTM
ncbi:hypothetical protein MDV097.6 [Gallid alphaherpesvirus 2]|uniref:Uncharacterized protein n=1 Tax=Gallid alphaherpesvirus 2 TaxID=10390 RepID=Q19B17_9ALPH|nr:hypothetical protein MDV097.6 [Gallid alphaherpesvirus 2]